MTRKFVSRNLLVPFCGILSMGLVACSGGDDDDDSSATPTQVPATPTPAYDDYFRVTEMLVGTATQGVDVDGISEEQPIDNNIEPTLNAISDTIYDAAVIAICYTPVEGEDPPADPDPKNCEAGPQTQLVKTIEQMLAAVFSVEAISDSINAPIESFDRNYLLNMKEQSRLGNAELGWFVGLFDGTGFALGQQLSAQNGKLDASGNGNFGPDDLTLTLSFTIPGQTEPLEFALVLHSGYTDVFEYDRDELNDIMTGGAMAMSDLLGFVLSMLERMDEVIPEPGEGQDDPFVPEEIMTQIETVVLPYADVDLNGDGSTQTADDGFSIGLVVQAGHIVPVD